MNDRVIFMIVLILGVQAHGYTFQEAIQNLSRHESIEQLKSQGESLKSQGRMKGSWGDPRLKIAAKNFPKSSLRNDKTPMTGLEVGLSKKIPLTTKYGNIESAFGHFSQAKYFEAANKKRDLLKKFWNYLIDKRRIKGEIQIFKENLVWVEKTLKISKKLYSNGKISQQTLLDIQIRKTELETDVANKEFQLKEQKDLLSYIINLQGELDYKTIPWSLLKNINQSKDVRELSLKAQLKGRKHLLTASSLSYVPDLTFSVAYTKRANIDKQGDFVSASIAFPLPLSTSKYAARSQAFHKRSQARRKLQSYQRLKKSEVQRLNHAVQRISQELNVLKTKTLRYAENSRVITSKSYRLGGVNYVELLQSELKLQKLHLKKLMLLSQLSKKQISYKYLIGEKLYE